MVTSAKSVRRAPLKTARSGRKGATLPAPKDVDELQQRASELLQLLQGPQAEVEVALPETRLLTLAARDLRDYATLLRLAEAVGRVAPQEVQVRRLYAQALIDTGQVTVAIDLLDALLQRLPPDDPEAAEAAGLRGRAFKQLYFDAADKRTAAATHALAQAIEAYRGPYLAAPSRHTWHGVNLLALLCRARRQGLDELAPDLDVSTLAQALVKDLKKVAPSKRDPWYLPTLAEASLGLALGTGDLRPIEQTLHAYVTDPAVQAFQVASTLRQFTEVWDLDGMAEDPHTPAGLRRVGRLTDILRARLLQLPGGTLEIPVRRMQRAPVAKARSAKARAQEAAEQAADRSQLEAILGKEGPKTLAWWRAGIDAARSVAVVRQRLGRRLGTGFLVNAGDFGLSPADERLLLTNFHVVNPQGAAPGIKPALAEVIFEAVDPQRVHTVAQIVWCSPIDQHDACLLRLQTAPAADVPALSLSAELPPRPAAPNAGAAAARVYVIGHPGGRELSVSFQDNELLDHEGAPDGVPQIPGVCRVHYRAPTEGGNSGSPVFESEAWQVIALHHKGGKLGMPRLNGQEGSYAANEGLALGALQAAARQALTAQAAGVGQSTP